MSASTSPTLRPIRASATARLAETVDLPTPPLPDPTAMIRIFGLSAIIATRVSATWSRSASLIATSSRSRSIPSSPDASSTSTATPASVTFSDCSRACASGGNSGFRVSGSPAFTLTLYS